MRHPGGAVGDAVGGARQHGGHALRRPAIGHVGELDTLADRQVLHRQVIARGDAAGREGELAGLRLGGRDELRPCLPGPVRLHRDAIGPAADPHHMAVVLRRVPERLLDQEGPPHDGQVHLAERVAIGLCGRERLRMQRAGGARPVLDHHRLAERLLRLLAHRAHLHVGGGSGGPGDDHADRPVGELPLRARRRGERTPRRQQRAAARQACLGHGVILPVLLRSMCRVGGPGRSPLVAQPGFSGSRISVSHSAGGRSRGSFR